MADTFQHDVFMSPFSWRYGSDAMRRVWSEIHKRQTWRRLWLALAQAEAEAGLVTPEQVADLAAHVDDVDITRAHKIEAQIHHDLMAEVQTFAGQCPIGGGIIHLGATSADIEDNADVLRIRASLDLTLSALRDLLTVLANRIDQHAGDAVMAFTHIQPAEPTTIGYRLSLYGQDLLEDYAALKHIRANLRGKGFKGAVGTSASYTQLLEGTGMTPAALEARIMESVDLPAYPIASQTYPRKQDWQVLSALSGLAASLHKFAFDLRLLQSPVIGEWHEPFGKQQVGSSAMPFKRNPINAEKTDSLARLIAAQVQPAWENAALSLLERTLDDSANRREILPVAFLATDEIVSVSTRLIAGLRIDITATARNLRQYGLFAALERVLMAAVRAGADRQHMHEVLRGHSLAAWESLSRGEPNPLVSLLLDSADLQPYLTSDQIHTLMDATTYVGDAPDRARQLAQAIRSALT